MAKPLSEVNHGNPGNVAPVAASIAYSSCPGRALPSVAVPWRSLTAMDALTAEVRPACGSVAGFSTATYQRSVPLELKAS